METALGLLWAWDAYEKAVKLRFATKYRTVTLPPKPTCSANDISIICPTIDTEESFTESVRLWLAAQPHEIIIVTVSRCKAEVERLIKPLDSNKINVLISPMANKRLQLVAGALAAKGKILALVDDDVYWRQKSVVPYLLAPFEDAQVGAVGGLQSPEIPPERQHSGVITFWEAAAALDMVKLNCDQPVRYAADGGCWALVGRTFFVRASIMRDRQFIQNFTHDDVNKATPNGADDVHLTEWVLDQGWRICVQNAPEAEITANVKRDSGFVLQNLRWERGNFRSFLARLTVKPGIREFSRRHPYLTRQMVEKLTRPIWAAVYAGVWVQVLRTKSWLAWLFIGWLCFGPGGWVHSYLAFAKRYPYMAGKIWLLFLVERMWPLFDVYTFYTRNNDSWLTRPTSSTSS